jgi:hypothetical protein
MFSVSGSTAYRSSSILNPDFEASGPPVSSLPLSPKGPSPPSQIFTGREDILMNMRGALCDPHSDSRVVYILYGLGGAGKTEIAAKFAKNEKSQCVILLSALVQRSSLTPRSAFDQHISSMLPTRQPLYPHLGA